MKYQNDPLMRAVMVEMAQDSVRSVMQSNVIPVRGFNNREADVGSWDPWGRTSMEIQVP